MPLGEQPGGGNWKSTTATLLPKLPFQVLQHHGSYFSGQVFKLTKQMKPQEVFEFSLWKGKAKFGSPRFLINQKKPRFCSMLISSSNSLSVLPSNCRVGASVACSWEEAAFLARCPNNGISWIPCCSSSKFMDIC